MINAPFPQTFHFCCSRACWIKTISWRKTPTSWCHWNKVKIICAVQQSFKLNSKSSRPDTVLARHTTTGAVSESCVIRAPQQFQTNFFGFLYRCLERKPASWLQNSRLFFLLKFPTGKGNGKRRELTRNKESGGRLCPKGVHFFQVGGI